MHYLLDVDNEVSGMPAFLLQRNVDGEFVSAEQWNTGYSFRLLPADALEHTISAQDAHLNNAVLLESLNGESGEDRILWHMNVDQETTVNGPAAVHLRIKTQDCVCQRKSVAKGLPKSEHLPTPQ